MDADHEYRSIDTVHEDSIQYAADFLNNLEFDDVPQHLIRIQIGMTIVVFRSLNTSVPRGSTLLVTALSNKLIEAQILNGEAAGEIVLIPRIVFKVYYYAMGVMNIVYRRQFPIASAFW